MHEPLSQKLTQILDNHTTSQAVTANLLLEQTEGRGIYFFMILLGLPFVPWISPPGLSTILGSIIMVLAIRLALRKPPHIPKRFGDRELPPAMMKLLRGSGVKFLRFLEKGMKPRRTFWLSWRMVHASNSLLVAFMAFLLALPLPSPPFYGTNALPSYAIILLAASMMEEDGVLIWVGYATSLITVVYFGLWAEIIHTHLAQWLRSLMHFFGA